MFLIVDGKECDLTLVHLYARLSRGKTQQHSVDDVALIYPIH